MKTELKWELFYSAKDLCNFVKRNNIIPYKGVQLW